MIPATERYCDICNNGEIEDEVHFLFRCSFYNDIRNKYFQDLDTCYSNKSHEEQYNVLKELLQNVDEEVILQVTNFINYVMEKRKSICLS